MPPQETTRSDGSQSGGAVSLEDDAVELQAPTAAAPADSNTGSCEEAHDYAGVLAHFRTEPPGRCVQAGPSVDRSAPAHSPEARGEGRWASDGFCATRQGPIQVSHDVSALEGPALRAWAMEQPPYFRAEPHVEGRTPSGKCK